MYIFIEADIKKEKRISSKKTRQMWWQLKATACKICYEGKSIGDLDEIFTPFCIANCVFKCVAVTSLLTYTLDKAQKIGWKKAHAQAERVEVTIM